MEGRNGRYLYWFHNHGGFTCWSRLGSQSQASYLCWFHNHGGFTYGNQRNPARLAAGHEVDTPAGKVIAWSEPEILLYDDDLTVRMSYPDFVEDGGRYLLIGNWICGGRGLAHRR